MDREKTVCLTGHRPRLLPWGYDESKNSCQKFKECLKNVFCEEIEDGFSIFMTGMAEGFDMIATEVLLELREEKDISIIAVIPCARQEIKWKKSQQLRYKKLIDECNQQIVLSQHYTSQCMIERNKYMVDRASLCIACFNGRPSGTEKTLKYALANDCKIRIINPEKFRN